MVKSKSVERTNTNTTTSNMEQIVVKKRGWEEIEDLFDAAKQRNDNSCNQPPNNKNAKARHTVQERKHHRYDGKETSTSTTSFHMESSKYVRKQQYDTKTYPKKCSGNDRTSSGNTQLTDQWMEDGLGGKFNREGYTGRIEDGVKIFKAHILSKPNAGSTSDCPFDCDCCYI